MGNDKSKLEMTERGVFLGGQMKGWSGRKKVRVNKGEGENSPSGQGGGR